MNTFLLIIDIAVAFGTAYLMHAYLEGLPPFKDRT